MTYLRRYTDVLSLLDMLKHNRLSLLSPATWFDQNDTFGLKEYGKRLGDESVFALCMTEGPERVITGSYLPVQTTASAFILIATSSKTI